MPFPRLFRFLCILLVGCLMLPPLEAASRRSKRSGASKSAKYKKAKSKKAKYAKAKKSRSGKYSKASKGKKGRYAKRGKGKRNRVDYSARPSKPQKRSSELPMTYAEWEKQQRRR